MKSGNEVRREPGSGEGAYGVIMCPTLGTAGHNLPSIVGKNFFSEGGRLISRIVEFEGCLKKKENNF